MTRSYLKIVFLIIFVSASLLYSHINRSIIESAWDNQKALRVEEINDGDTVTATINRRSERIRLIGIDAPELGQVPWGRRAKKHLERLISDSGWKITIEYDIEKRDRYNRILAYLWTRDGKLINEEMLRNGYAMLYTFPPNIKYVDRLTTAQKEARERKVGIWGKKGLRETPSEYRREHRITTYK